MEFIYKYGVVLNYTLFMVYIWFDFTILNAFRGKGKGINKALGYLFIIYIWSFKYITIG